VCTGTGTAGGTLRFLFGDSPVVIEVEAAEPARHVRWLVAVSEPLPEWAGTHIDFELRADTRGGTGLGFCHEGLTEQSECFDACTAGWRQYLPSLAEYVDCGGGTAFGSENDERAAHWQQSRTRG
jgi:activator of Hsp90 ATPase-like protein